MGRLEVKSRSFLLEGMKNNVVAPGVTNTRKIRGEITGLEELGRGEWWGRSVR